LSANYSKIKVFIALALGLTSFGFAPILVRLATEYSAVQISTIRTVLGALILIPIYLSRNKEIDSATPILKKEHKWMALAGIMLGLHFMSWTGSLYFTSVASASVLVTIHPIILILAERTLYRINFAVTVWIGVGIAFMGSMLLGYADYNAESTFINPALGNALAFIAAVIFAIYFLIGRRVRQNHSLIEYLFPVYTWAAITSVVILIIVEGFTFPLDQKILLIGLGLAAGPQIIGHGALNYAIKYVSPTLLSTLILAEPLLASLLALFLFEELPSVISISAMCIILLGVSLTWRKTTKTPNNVSI